MFYDHTAPLYPVPGLPCYIALKQSKIAGWSWAIFTNEGDRLEDGDSHMTDWSALYEAKYAAETIYGLEN